MAGNKFALIHLGNEESYGLLFAADELAKHGEIKFFDAEMGTVADIVNWSPDYICFSPMTTFYEVAKSIEWHVKHHSNKKVKSIYGGHHASNCGTECGDITVVGSCSGINPAISGIYNGGSVKPDQLHTPRRAEYFRDIPRMESRYRKVMLSVTGCPWTCTYCSSGGACKELKHRDIEDIIHEARVIKNNTQEIEWVDDDVFYGDKDWLRAFYKRWTDEIGIPMYVSTTSISALKAPPDLLKQMRGVVNCIGLGVQAARPSSLELLGRKWDNMEQVKAAYDYLTSFGFRVNLQGIVGLPTIDPVEDALDTVEAIRKIGPGSVCSIYPLQIYPNTKMEKYCKDNLWTLNPACTGDTNSGLPAIDFGEQDNNRIRNICKLATMMVKYNIGQPWLYSMLDMDLSGASKNMSMVRYYECVRDRLPDKADKIFSDIVKGMNVRY